MIEEILTIRSGPGIDVTKSSKVLTLNLKIFMSFGGIIANIGLLTTFKRGQEQRLLEKEKTQHIYGYIDIDNQDKKHSGLIFLSLCLTSRETFELQWASRARLTTQMFFSTWTPTL